MPCSPLRECKQHTRRRRAVAGLGAHKFFYVFFRVFAVDISRPRQYPNLSSTPAGIVQSSVWVEAAMCMSCGAGVQYTDEDALVNSSRVAAHFGDYAVCGVHGFR